MKKLLKVNIRNRKLTRGTTLSTCVWKFKENQKKENPSQKNSISEIFDIPKYVIATAENIKNNTNMRKENKKNKDYLV